MSQPAAALPVLDLSRFDAAPAKRAALLAELGATARDTGFFYLTGHGISRDKPDRLTQSVREPGCHRRGPVGRV